MMVNAQEGIAMALAAPLISGPMEAAIAHPKRSGQRSSRSAAPRGALARFKGPYRRNSKGCGAAAARNITIFEKSELAISSSVQTSGKSMQQQSELIDQTRLATELGLTPRRIRQLVETYVLPPAHHETGLYDRRLCAQRYRLYSDGSPRDWDEFLDEAEDGTRAARAVFAKAFDDGAVQEDVAAASRAVQADACRMHFLTACRSKAPEEKALFHGLWSRQEDDCLRHLIARLMELQRTDRIVDAAGNVTAVLPVYPQLPAQRRSHV